MIPNPNKQTDELIKRHYELEELDRQNKSNSGMRMLAEFLTATLAILLSIGVLVALGVL